MKHYLVLSINQHGCTITTHHYSPMSVATEKLRRSLAGHNGITVQDGPLILTPEPLRKRLSPLLSKGGASD